VTRVDPHLVVESLLPRSAEMYLHANGWEPRERTPMFSTWYRRVDDRPVQLFLPLSPEPADFADRLVDFVVKLAAVEHRDEDTVLTNLRYTAADLVRVRLVSQRTGEGELPIEEGTRLFEGARDMMLAAACAAVNYRPNFGPRKPAEASEFLDRVRLGQTEKGSYVVTVITDLPDATEGTLFEGATDELIWEPFERRVTTTLVNALSAADLAAHQAMSDPSAFEQAFDDAVERGVTANLCDALGRIVSDEDAPADIRVSVDWAPAMRVSDTAPRAIELDTGVLSVVRAAGDHLKKLGPFEGVRVEGYVRRLVRGKTDQIGTVVIEGTADGEQRNVHVELSDEQYHEAIEAHDDRLPVEISGTLYKSGRNWRLGDLSPIVVRRR
jgi:hypothetical protein